jgi:hypothetical protein
MPSRLSLALARKINRLWLRCAKGHVDLSRCPSDADIAALLEKALTRKPDAKK